MEENCYGLRNRKRNDREVEEGSDDEDQEPENGGNDYDRTKRRRKKDVHHKGHVLTKNMSKIRATIGKMKVCKSQ